MINEAERAMRDGETHIVIDRSKDPNPVSRMVRWQMLAFPWRQFVIEKVKAPLMQALERESRRLVSETGTVSVENPLYAQSASLISLKDWFMSMEDNPGRAPLFEAAFNLLIARLEGIKWSGHDTACDAAIVLANRLLNAKVGVPDKSNCFHPHARILIDLRDWDMSLPDVSGKSGLFLASWDITIYEVEHDPYYDWRYNRILNRIVSQVNAGTWHSDEYNTVYGFRFNRILAKLVEKVNSGEWKFEPYKPADNFCWKEFKKQ